MQTFSFGNWTFFLEIRKSAPRLYSNYLCQDSKYNVCKVNNIPVYVVSFFIY